MTIEKKHTPQVPLRTEAAEQPKPAPAPTKQTPAPTQKPAQKPPGTK